MIGSALAVVVVVGLAAPSTTVTPMAPEELAARSDVVAHVTVAAARVERVGGRIVTFYDVDVVDVWRAQTAPAQVPRRLTVASLGGVVDGVGQHVAGMPRFVVGREYVLCLGPANAGGPRGARGVVGLWQGAWDVEDVEDVEDGDGTVRLRQLTHDGHAGPGAPFELASLRALLTWGTR